MIILMRHFILIVHIFKHSKYYKENKYQFIANFTSGSFDDIFNKRGRSY